jgi:hypothetical protein
MREYMIVPEALLAERRAVDAWLARSMAYVGTMETKSPKPRKSANSNTRMKQKRMHR